MNWKAENGRRKAAALWPWSAGRLPGRRETDGQQPGRNDSSHHPVRHGPRRRGAAVLEAALVLGILLSLSLGSGEAGYYLWIKHVMEGAAWSGARAAITANATNTDVQTAINNALTSSSITSSYVSYTITPAASAAPAGSSITVKVIYDWKNGGFHFLNIFGDTATGTAVMRKEGS